MCDEQEYDWAISSALLAGFEYVDENENGQYDMGEEFDESDLAISEGSLIRVIRAPYFGKVGIVKSLPHDLTKMESETLVRIAEIEFEDGSVEIIPRANLEMILT